MRVLLLADPNSTHTIKWVKFLSQKGLDIGLFGLGEIDLSNYQDSQNIKFYSLTFKKYRIANSVGSLSKLRYLNALPAVRKAIKEFKPDILHAHYATSYGLLGALSGFHPFILSVWGTDVFKFPLKSFLHALLLKFNFKKADKILSTSHVMADETKKYISKEIEVTPFGIDTAKYRKYKVKSIFGDDDFVIGTVKILSENYGVEYLIQAFETLVKKYPDHSLKLLIVGDGPQKDYLVKLSEKLGIAKHVIFTGFVPYHEVPVYLNMMKLFVTLSNSESFGVAVLEASACELPVVVTNVGGLPEIIEDGVTGYAVPPRDPERAAEATEKIILDRELWLKMGKAGRQRVLNYYAWDENVIQMIGIYMNILD